MMKFVKFTDKTRYKYQKRINAFAENHMNGVNVYHPYSALINSETKEIIACFWTEDYSDFCEPFITFGVHKKFRRKGYAKQIVEDSIGHLFEDEGADIIMATCVVKESFNLLTDMGFSSFKIGNLIDEDVSLDREAWEDNGL